MEDEYKIADHPLGKQYIKVLNILINNIEHIAQDRSVLNGFTTHLYVRDEYIMGYDIQKHVLTIRKVFENFTIRMVYNQKWNKCKIPTEYFYQRYPNGNYLITKLVTTIFRDLFKIITENKCKRGLEHQKRVLRTGFFYCSNPEEPGPKKFRYEPLNIALS